jgi:MFS family permease
MPPDQLSRRTIIFVNIAHAMDHFILLVYPTAVIAIAADRGLDYPTLISLATGAFVAFGLFSLPVGWVADRAGRRNMLAVFFIGYGASCLGMATAGSAVALAGWLLVLGIFAAIYHPVGSTMLVTHARQLGRDLGWNGVWGNLGAASASGATALIAANFGWQLSFVLPGTVCILAGLAFIALVPGDGTTVQRAKTVAAATAPASPVLLLTLFGIAIIAGGMTFNVTTIALPKILDERLGAALPMTLTGSLATAVFTFGALAQLSVGRLLDRFTPAGIFVGLSLLQPIGLTLAAMTTGLPLLLGMFLVMVAIYGQVVVNDAMVARYVPAHYRAKAFSIRYFLGFTASGFAAPFIAALHLQGGFPVVLAGTAMFGVVVALCAAAFKAVLSRGEAAASVPAE